MLRDLSSRLTRPSLGLLININLDFLFKYGFVKDSERLDLDLSKQISSLIKKNAKFCFNKTRKKRQDYEQGKEKGSGFFDPWYQSNNRFSSQF